MQSVRHQPNASRIRKLPPPIAISILAGGLSTRMGRDKAKLRYEGKTLLGHVRATAAEIGCPVRVIRRDLIARCGPLGGIHTALNTGRADAELFLACDMPFISPALLVLIVGRLGSTHAAAFSVVDGLAGFPFVIRRDALPVIDRQIREKKFSLQALADALDARTVTIPKTSRHELFNINTPEEWLEAKCVNDLRLSKRTK